MDIKKPLTATNLAVHQHLNCDLYIHNVYNKVLPDLKTRPASPSELAKAHFKRGNDWESVLYSWLDDEQLLLKVPAVPLQADSLLENILADERDHFFITGLCFWPPQAQLNDRFLQVGAEPLNFGLAKPDLIEIKRTKEGIQWRVIDAKASKHVKTSHHVQIYFYTLCLSHILHAPFYWAAASAGIWLPPREGFQTAPPSIADIKSISISLLAPAVDAFIFQELPQVLSLPIEDVNWHYNPLCRGCRYEPDCKSRAVKEKRIGIMPNISIDDAKILKSLLRVAQPSPHLTDIEDLHEIIDSPARLDQIANMSPTILKKAKQILLLPKKKKGILESPVVEAALRQKVQVVSRRNYTCPGREDVAVVVSLVNDPSSSNNGGDYFCVTIHSDVVSPPSSFCCPATDFIAKLAALIRSIISDRYTCQFYIWNSPEQLQAHIINAALEPGDNNDNDIRLCIGALAEGASLLQTTFQPLLLSGALLNFLAKGKQTKSEYKACLERLGLPTDGTIEVLRKRVNAEVQRIQEEARARSSGEERRKEIGQLPRVVPLKKEIERQLALPTPGYWDLPECVSVLLPAEGSCSTDDEILTAYKNFDRVGLDIMLLRRNRLIYSVLKEFRKSVVQASTRLVFVNKAKVLSANIMDLCKQPHIRKLFFMQQFEVLAKLTALWRSRIDGCPDAPTLKYCGTTQGFHGPEYIFNLLSGEVDAPAADKEYAFYDKLLVLDAGKPIDGDTNYEDLPVETLFDDLGVSGLMFPLNRWTMPAWEQQNPMVQRELFVADVRNVYAKGTHKTKVVLQIWPGGKLNTTLKVGDVYRLSPRLVDFNTSKILSTLFENDLQWESEGALWADEDSEDDLHHDIPFLQLIAAPNSFGKIQDAKKYVKTEAGIQKLFRDLKDLGNGIAGSLVLKSSQHKAAQRILSNRLSVIWGPPGTL
ncbi:hypothetical protein BDN70DRAFT_902787 [Pholiota conissans]|uniref:PD-(D/E)XK endonuclease-like domain-containing protein n=1 Tax=Pholiota conissans TaxID=109636 RepID=A0A9P5ZE41_9AGAR|nr:hypothetical protein BDN70DRAFT_902787 [Pholiota conissans]